MTNGAEKIFTDAPRFVAVHPRRGGRRLPGASQGRGIDAAIDERLVETDIEMHRSSRGGKRVELSGHIDIDDRCGGRSEEWQLVDRLRRTGAAQTARAVGRDRDERQPGASRFEHGG